DLFVVQDKLAEAEQLFELSLAIREKALGPKHPDVADSLNNLAALLQAHGKIEKADLTYRRAMQVLESTVGVEHPHYASTLSNLAEV
ncbi:unnamed protein product, partial [Hapterophycus canaliculatus]